MLYTQGESSTTKGHMNATGQVQRGLPLSSFITIDIGRKISPIPLSEQYALKEALRGIAPGSSLLDIGSGYGRLFPFYHSLGFIITGCEPNKEYATYLRGSYPNTLVLPVTVQNLSEGNIYDIACV